MKISGVNKFLQYFAAVHLSTNDFRVSFGCLRNARNYDKFKYQTNLCIGSLSDWNFSAYRWLWRLIIAIILVVMECPQIQDSLASNIDKFRYQNWRDSNPVK